jgi:phosphoribosylglycinamide formyltransferase-1
MFNLGILASGRGSNFDAIRQSCDNGYLAGFAQVVVLITDAENAPVREIARAHGIPDIYLAPPLRKSAQYATYMECLAETMAEHKVVLVCCAGFMRLLQEPFLNRYRNRTLNIHPSLLPRFPGLHPQAQALTEGVNQSGCTVHYVDETLDGGPIVLQGKVEVYPDTDTIELLSNRILALEHELYPIAIRKVLSSKGSTHAPARLL